MDAGEDALSDRAFARIKQRVHELSGIALGEAKRTLVVSRLARVLRELGFASFDNYLDYLNSRGSPLDIENFINALTTNLTRFGREEHHFTHLCEQLPALMARRQRHSLHRRPRLRIWSAGCSTGQEAYTIAISLLTAFPELRRWDFKILATDIDTSVLARAELGVYAESELRGLPEKWAARFEPCGEGNVRVPLEAREVVWFKPLNLVAAPWPMRGPFDAIFCRNVAIYFDRTTQATLFTRLGALLAPDGYLYVGHSESLGADSDGFRSVGRTIYQLKAAARNAA